MAGEKRQNVWIIVSVPPIISRGPREMEAEEDGTALFNCQVTATKYPVTTIIWKKDGNYIKMGSTRHHTDKANGTLIISDVKMRDAGTYACVANTTGHNLVSSSLAYLRVKKKLKFSPMPRRAHILLSKDSSVPCRAEGDGPVRIHWVKNGQPDSGTSRITVDGTLQFINVQRSDEGWYTCIASSQKQGSINITIYIDVVEMPKFQISPQNLTVYEGQPVMLHCVAIGDPKPDVNWDKNYFRDFDFSRVKFFTNGTLSISRVYMEDKGRYGCTANNTAGKTRREAFLNVATSTDFVDSKPNSDEGGFDMMKTVIIAVCSAGAYLALVIALTAYCSYRLLLQRKNRKALMKSENGNINQEQHELLAKDRDSESRTQFRSDSDNRSHASGLSSQPSHSSQSQSHSQRSRRGSFDRYHFPRQNLGTLGMLGTGMYGDVFLAKARGIRDVEPETLVVVKSLLTKDEHLFFEFRQEMDMYSKLDHPFVIKLLGVCREMEPQFMITEYCDWGDLKQFLLATRGNYNGRPMPTRVPPLTVAQKLNMCNQVALGMEHIANHRFIHKDLAARNILLTSRLELKISSLSLCRDIYAGEYYLHSQSLIPLRWLPSEAVFDDEYSTKSDVWAFGVFMWEVFHSGEFPFSSLADDEVLRRLKVSELKLPMIEQIPAEIAEVIRKCTLDSPRERPLFSDLCLYLSDIMTKVQSSSAPMSPATSISS
ncbi:hypothetical protein FSP39_009604 [Pinctada imbricata]|uniref:Receptor protein-tyrosine kinase n=1 Tax=Pinctada imbricata TaxID=66713 RepID=A0AA89BSU1_PINIB|nr:hypothetical protein FSP39_009604 [Pinctada imbricata]